MIWYTIMFVAVVGLEVFSTTVSILQALVAAQNGFGSCTDSSSS